MWKCPKCEAMNYEKGACECCGYKGNELTQVPYWITYPYIGDTSDTPYEAWTYPRIWC